jgi:tRNA wybutosine-synthesizing protein 2
MMLIFGKNTESVRLENSIHYLFDVCKVMFASGNVDERERMGRLDCKSETVLDMFAGIGYFTLPIAKFSGAKRVVACEKNPESYRYLVRNVDLNQVSDRVETVLGDNRDLPDRPFAHRILMGYVHRTREFLPKALNLLLPGGIVHYHENYHVRDAREMLERDLDQCCDGRPYEILGMREVKSYAPSVSHYVADIRFH